MKINLNYKKTARIISMMCGLLFSIFSIVYLYVFQTDVLEAMHFSLAHGKTIFSPVGSSLMITVLLLALSLLLSRFLNIRGSWQSFAYIPAFILLVSLTDVRRGIYTADYGSYNFWLYSSLFVLSLLLLFLFRSSFAHSVRRGMVYPAIYIVNVVCLLIFMLATAMAGTTDKLYHNELHVESCLRKGDNYNALMVARHSAETSRTLTALRALALSKENLMGEKLFEYPQNYKSEGLSFSSDSLTTLRYNNDSIVSYLRLTDLADHRVMQQLAACSSQDSCSKAVVDYYLSGLLLDKRLNDFVAVLPKHYAPDKTLPKHYKEALILYGALHADTKSGEIDLDMQTAYQKYLEDKKNLHQHKYEYSLMKDKYDKTYWWYFDYQQ